MKHPKDLTGMRFYRLVVIRKAMTEEIINTKKNGYWICECDCGKLTKTRKDRLLSGWTKSCGCLFLETKTIHGNTTKGKTTQTYHSWRSMKDRCLNPNVPWYHNYGGRGIKICDRWINSFENFLTDMGERLEATTLDRIDSNGNYEPKNCKWSGNIEQSTNRRTTHQINFNDKTQSIKKWCEEYKLPYSSMCAKYRQGKFNLEEIVKQKFGT